MADSGFAWSWGPKNSVSVRLLLYLCSGILGSWFTGPVIILLLRSSDSGYNEISWIVIILLLIFIWGRRIPSQDPQELATLGVKLRDRLLREFIESANIISVVGAVIIATSVFVFLSRHTSGSLDTGIWFICISAGLIVPVIIAYLLSSEGAIDPESQTLIYRGHKIQLTNLKDIKRMSIGNRTILWASFQDESKHPISFPHLFVMPTRIVDQTWSIFETDNTVK